MGVLKFPKLGLPWLWRPITLCVDLWLMWGLKQSFIPHQNIFNDVWHTTCTQGNQGDSRFLMIGSQIDNLTPDLSFGHNLCFKNPNGSCEPILIIYVPRSFQWYKRIINSMSFDYYNCPLTIRESIGIPTPKVRMWGFIPSHSFALWGAWNVTPMLTFGPHLCKPLPWLWAQG